MSCSFQPSLHPPAGIIFTLRKMVNRKTRSVQFHINRGTSVIDHITYGYFKAPVSLKNCIDTLISSEV